MKCDELFKFFSEYYDGEASNAVEINAHLKACSACANEYANFCKMIEEVKNLPEPQPPSGFCDDLMQGVLQHAARKKRQNRRVFYRSFALAAAACFLLALVWFTGWRDFGMPDHSYMTGYHDVIGIHSAAGDIGIENAQNEGFIGSGGGLSIYWGNDYGDPVTGLDVDFHMEEFIIDPENHWSEWHENHRPTFEGRSLPGDDFGIGFDGYIQPVPSNGVLQQYIPIDPMRGGIEIVDHDLMVTYCEYMADSRHVLSQQVAHSLEDETVQTQQIQYASAYRLVVLIILLSAALAVTIVLIIKQRKNSKPRE